MPRVKRGVTARARHKKVLEQAKGFRGRRGNVFRVAPALNVGRSDIDEALTIIRESFEAAGAR